MIDNIIAALRLNEYFLTTTPCFPLQFDHDKSVGFEVPDTFPPSHFDSASGMAPCPLNFRASLHMRSLAIVSMFSVSIKSGKNFLFGWLQSSCTMWCSMPLRYSSPHGFKHVIQSRYKYVIDWMIKLSRIMMCV